ncbi:D-alanyl-D-alanine carboxypeptidase [Streptomyces sp. NBC_00414]|uniref:D-alanyl-D-alanine carboxypeptidase n=1 Tax=Streptomyces sp. NBC_00414 TaxID=2975739 RepID=UPI002E2058A6
MAGESPDRSKQHESSAEPTSGSKVPVPDPRLAVAREAVTAAARVDTATAVFSTKRSAGPAGSKGSAGAEETAEPAAGSSQGSDGSAEPESSAGGAGKGAGGGDARLRSAVAAWVATADEEAPEGAPADAAADSAAPGVGAPAGEGGDGDSDPGVGSDPGSDSDESGSGAGTDAGAGPDSEPEDSAAAEAPADASAEAKSESEGESEGDASEDAPAGRAVPPVPQADASPKSGTSASGESDGKAAAGDESGADAKADAKRTADAPEAEVPAAKPPVGAAPAADGDAGSDRGVGSDADSAAKPDATAKAASDAKPESDAKAASDAKPDPVTKSDAAAKPESGVKPTSDAKPDTAAKPDSGADSGSAVKSDSTPGEGRPKPPVDQATAIFKRPAAVDQPTTMLKLGGAKPDAKPDAGPGKTADSAESAEPGKGVGSDKGAEPGKGVAPKGGAESAGEPKGEAPAERTSKFVALKPLDEPAPPKAKPAVPPPGPSVPSSVAPAPETAVVPQVGPERTTQQPLPPRPPLDLLAELTNTPPPRQTPVRTLVRRVKIWTPLVLLLAVVFAVVQAVRPLPAPTLTLTADESYAFEGNKVSLPWPEEGQGWMDVNGIGTVDSFGAQKPVAIGSVAKAMTAYVILKEHPLKAGADGAKIEVDKKAETEGGYDAQGESTLNTVKEGDTLTEKDAIAAIMIPSANNIARLLARWDAGSEAKFVEKMNAAAKDLGMKNTKYTDPSGLKETTVSTAEDQVKLGNELVDIKALVDITKLPTWVDPSGKKWDNYNRLVPYNNAIGIKTGSTTKAGGNLLFAATQEVGGENVIVVGAILGQHTPPIIDTVNAVSKTAMVAAQDALTSRKILKKGDVVGYVDDGLGGQVPVVATKDVSAVGWAGQTVKLKLDEGGATIPHEAKAGTEVGSLSVGDGTTGDAVEVPVALQSDLTEPGYGAKLTRVS